ncbi:MAG: TIGR00341 family protein [Alphaproteobacteria bacterium]|nr:TIGR00341 family protein [Alphaproteobacteria bacterium]
MSLRIIEISAPESALEKIKELSQRYEAIDCWQASRNSWLYKQEDKRVTSRILVDVQNQQDLLDALQRAVSRNEGWRITLIPVEATMPKPEEINAINGNGKFKVQDILRGSVTREELESDMEKGAKVSFDFLLLVFLSSIVAGIGLLQSDVAIIIGAMVIAPLLGPNLALAFGAALGNKELILKAIQTNIIGLGFTLLIAALASLLIPNDAILESTEMMSRTSVGYASIILALASGAAAVLSLTTGVSSALVGVMVAVALMPPAVTLGLTLGNGQMDLAYGAFLLLSTNVVCVNLAAQGIFRLKGIRPRTWYEEKKAKTASRINTLIWLLLLTLLAALIWLKTELGQG